MLPLPVFITQVIPSWELLISSRLSGGRELGPELARLPEELLPALSKYLFIGKANMRSGMISAIRSGMIDAITYIYIYILYI